MGPGDRRRRAEHLDQTALRGHWLARWPDAHTPTVVVALHATEEGALAGFDSSVQVARALASPRYSFEVLRRGDTVVLLKADHWIADANEWLDRVRTLFPDTDARQEASGRLLDHPPTN